MNWPDDIMSSLPEPHDDEPASLRGDIADELADHLSCALNRELHFTRDEKSAIQKVLDRFGDPRAIARRLWFDSMKDKIMTQRIALVASVLAAAASIAACAMVYVVVEQSRASSAAIVEQTKSIVEQGAATNQALLAKIDALSDKSSNVEFVKAKVRLVTDAPGSPPAVGYSVALSDTRGEKGRASEVEVHEKTNANGEVDFGLLRYGMYSLRFTTPAQEYSTTISLRISLGKDVEKVFVVPRGPIEEGDVSVRTNWQEDILKEQLVSHLFLYRMAREVGGLSWYINDPVPDRYLVVSHDGRISEIPYRRDNPGLISEQTSGQAIDFQPAVRLHAGKYLLRSLVIRRPLGDGFPGRSDQSDRNEGPKSSELVSELYYRNPEEIVRPIPVFDHRKYPGFVEHRRMDDPESVTFEVKAGEQNVWDVKIRPSIIDSIREGFTELRKRDLRNAEVKKRAEKGGDSAKKPIEAATPLGNSPQGLAP